MASWIVVYLWQNERHIHSRWFAGNSQGHADAVRLANELRADGWQAWVERR